MSIAMTAKLSSAEEYWKPLHRQSGISTASFRLSVSDTVESLNLTEKVECHKEAI